MFCILYKLADHTGIKFFEKEVCFPECKYFKDNCSILKRKNVKLSTERFGWVVEDTVVFTTPVCTKHANTFYCSFLMLIHPTEKDVWLGKCLRKDKETVFYSAYSGTKRIDFNDLKALNYWLHQSKYNGRSLDEEDFK
jgi:hypothetical protein